MVLLRKVIESRLALVPWDVIPLGPLVSVVHCVAPGQV
mgnify:CR=1 FL=1